MPTVKLNPPETPGGRPSVILKNGKVSCSCCEAAECCMYPAATLVAGIYGYQDLPDAIDIDGIEYTKLDPPQSVSGFTRYYININEEYLGILDGEGEDSLWTYEGGGGPCLISGFNGEGGEREDQFADTYTVNSNLEYPWEEQGNPITIPVNGSFTLERFSLCQWRSSGFPSNAPFFVLNYVNLPPSENPILEEGPHWVLQVYFLEYYPGLFVSGLEFKNGPQNSPVGSYGTGIHGTASIS